MLINEGTGRKLPGAPRAKKKHSIHLLLSQKSELTSFGEFRTMAELLPAKKRTILVVDDDESLRLLCNEVLSEEGFNVIEAKDGEEAVRKVEKNNPDLVILDVQMARMDGMDALPRILRKKRDVPVILYTAYSQFQDDFMTWAADAYLIKSSDLTELKEKTKELLSAKRTLERAPYNRQN